MKKIWAILFTAILCVSLTVVSAACGSVTEVPVNDRNAETPVITVQPKNALLRKGEATQGLEIKAYANDNGSLSYRWYSNTSDSNSGGTVVEGADKSILALDASAEGTVYYYCVVTNNNASVGGEKTATAVSDTARVKVYSTATAPRIVGQPQGSDYIFGAQDEALPLAVDAAVSQGDLTYQWFASATGSYDGSDEIHGATSTQYVPDIGERGEMYYYCEITNTDATASEAQTAIVRTKIVRISIDYDYEGFTFAAIDEKTCKLTEYNGDSLYPYIPETDEEGRAVVEIGAGVFNQSKIVEVTIPDTVEILGIDRVGSAYGDENDGVFNKCSSLKTINFNGRFKFVGDFTFNQCTTLETNVFDYCGEMEFMGKGAFQALTCMPKEIVFPATLAGDLAKYAFQNCTNIEKITFAGEGVTGLSGSSFRGIATLKVVVIPASVVSFIGDAFKECSGLESFTILRSKTTGSITTKSPFVGNAANYPNMTIYVPADSVGEYKSSLGALGSLVTAIEE